MYSFFQNLVYLYQRRFNYKVAANSQYRQQSFVKLLTFTLHDPQNYYYKINKLYQQKKVKIKSQVPDTLWRNSEIKNNYQPYQSKTCNMSSLNQNPIKGQEKKSLDKINPLLECLILIETEIIKGDFHQKVFLLKYSFIFLRKK
ncbi:hypothetical protein pb186bvf_018108 [Paramecium bursaria]